jgi:hypothetical protein
MTIKTTGSTALLATSFVATLFLAGCASRENTEPDLQEKIASATASCKGYVSAFGDIPFQTSWLTCFGREQFYVAYADKIADRFSPCAFVFEPATNYKGVGRMACNNDTAGPLTYDMTDPKNIRVAATLDDGREMVFTMRGD